MEKKTELIHSFDQPATEKKQPMKGITIFIICIVLGLGTGFFIANAQKPSSMSTMTSSSGSVTTGQIVGSPDEKTFKDQAEGVLKEGGIDGEGAFHLERPGGESQNVYMTSSAVDLSQFIGKKVKVWGQTNSSKKAGWLMDVGRLQVL